MSEDKKPTSKPTFQTTKVESNEVTKSEIKKVNASEDLSKKPRESR